MTAALPLLLLDPHPRTAEMVYSDATAQRLAALCRVRAHIDGPAPDELVDELLPEVAIVVGQTTMDKERLDRAPNLKAIINVLANWRPNIDYPHAHRKGVHVLSVAPAMAPAVAEWTLAALLDINRGVSRAAQDFRSGDERYGIAGCRDSRTLRNAAVGLVGFGNLGKAFAALLQPFGCDVRVYDPWLDAGQLEPFGVAATGLERLLAECDCIAVFAGATVDNQGFLDRGLLERIKPGASVVLASRAAVVDFDALVELAAQGRFRLAVDVYPREPVAPDSPWRAIDSVLWSSHRAGADPSSYSLMQEMMLDDIAAIVAGRAPTRLQPADPERAALMNSI